MVVCPILTKAMCIIELRENYSHTGMLTISKSRKRKYALQEQLSPLKSTESMLSLLAELVTKLKA